VQSLAALLALAAVVLTTVVPCHRCIPAGSDGHGALVALGSHAHEGHGEHRGCGHSGDSEDDCGHENESDEPCCVDTPGDPSAAPSRLSVEVPLASEAVREWVAVTVPAPALIESPGRDQPVPRSPTATVVLLR
jgi:hypothetical protein